MKEVLPKSCTLSESLLGCVYEGTLDGSKVRVRRLRMHPGGDPRKVKEVCTWSHISFPSAHGPQVFHQMAAMSKYLEHPNIVPLLGVTTEPLELISDWMPGGDFLGYIATHPDADKFALVCFISAILHNMLIAPTVIRCRQRSQLPSFLQHGSWRSQRSEYFFWISPRHLTDVLRV